MTTTATGQTTGPEDNPLIGGLERLPVRPTALVIFGATGDLARRKLLPALYNLAHEGALPSASGSAAPTTYDGAGCVGR